MIITQVLHQNSYSSPLPWVCNRHYALWFLQFLILLGNNDNDTKPCLSRRTDASCKDFQGLVVAKSTAVLWGRRVTQVALSSSSALALSDLGELFVWGGHKKWWEDDDLKSFHPVKSRD